MTTVEGADSDRVGDVERQLVWPKREVLDGDVADAHATGRDLFGSVRHRLRNRIR